MIYGLDTHIIRSESEASSLKPKLYPAINGHESLLYGSASLAKVDVYSGGLLVSYT